MNAAISFQIGDVVKVKECRKYMMVSADGKSTVRYAERPWDDNIDVTEKGPDGWSKVKMTKDNADRHYRRMKAAGFVKW